MNPSSPAVSFPANGTDSSTTFERRLIFALFAFVIALRLFYPFIYRPDSDEAQHLHVVWAWAHKHLVYKEIFDNHAPLFHILLAPLFNLLGERADILTPMRLAMLPFYFGCLWAVYKIGAALYSPRAALWASLLAAVEPRFFLTSTEFRTDDMWALMWLLTLAALVCAGEQLTTARLFGVGVLLGATFATSMKTSLLLMSLAGSIAFVLVLEWRGKGGFGIPRQNAAAGLAALIAGALVIPMAIVCFFAAHHALGDLYYCVIQHNVVPGLKRWSDFGSHMIILGAGLPALCAATFALYRSGRPTPGGVRLRFWRLVVWMTPLLYIILLFGIWPDITREDYLPFSPLLMVSAAAGVLFCLRRLSCRAQSAVAAVRPPLWHCAVVCVLAGCGVALIFRIWPPTQNGVTREIVLIQEVLRLTSRRDYVMDAKAGAIFRPRPYYYVLEPIMRTRLRAGLAPDNVIERLIETRTAVVTAGGLTRATRASDFVSQNYVFTGTRVRQLMVLGKALDPTAQTGTELVSFEVKIPSRYTLLDQSGFKVCGLLDGTPFEGARELEAGNHQFQPQQQPAGRIVLFWAHAQENGFLPQWQQIGSKFGKDAAPAGK